MDNNRCIMCPEGREVCPSCMEKPTENKNYLDWFNILSLLVFTQIGQKSTNDIISEEQKEKLSNEVLKHLKSKMWQIIQKEGITVTNQNLDWLLERANR